MIENFVKIEYCKNWWFSLKITNTKERWYVMFYELEDLTAKALIEAENLANPENKKDLNDQKEIDLHKRMLVASKLCRKTGEPAFDTFIMKIEDISIKNLEILMQWAYDMPLEKEGKTFNFSELWSELYEEQKTNIPPVSLIIDVIKVFQKYNNQEGNPKNIRENAFYAVKRIGCHDIII